MNIAIVGYGSQGKSALEYWNTAENVLTVCDKKTDISVLDGVKIKSGPKYLEDLDAFDLIVRSPSVHPREIVAANSEAILNKVTSNTNEFFKVCPTKNIIGVTGTKGKGTTSTLITEMLKAMGKTVHLGGNIGTPPLELLKNDIKPDNWVVMELANFQLIDLKYGPKIGVCLMIEPEHLDWHEDLDEYLDAKSQLFIHQDEQSIAIYNANNPYSMDIASTTEGTTLGYMQDTGAYLKNESLRINETNVCFTNEIALPGKHNIENICAAITAVWQIEKNVESIRKVVTTFSGLPFRIELRAVKDGVSFYNDSFASAPGATIAAIETIKAPKVVIIGGYDRNLDLAPLAQSIKKHEDDIEHIVLIGASAERVMFFLTKAGFTRHCISSSNEMRDIVAMAISHTPQNGAVILSPGFPSFDMFKNFEDRGLQFNEAVEAL